MNWTRQLAAIVILVFLSTTFSMTAQDEIETLKIRIHGDAEQPTLIYLPGLHGDWTLVSSFRHEITNHVRFVEFTYPRTLTWSLKDYANEIQAALLANGISEGWLLAESFGSQIAWTLADKINRSQTFRIKGIILAGGFVKHPNAPGIFVAKQFTQRLPNACFKACLNLYGRYATFRHRHAPETLASIAECIERRTPLDRQAMTHRLDLLANSELRSIAIATEIPVFALAGFWDPIVPRVLTRLWLKQKCAGFKEARMIFGADHNVLGTAPSQSAAIVRSWMEILKNTDNN